MKPKREVRSFTGAQIRAAAAKAGAEGYAAVFNQGTDLGWFKEKIKPGAFTRAIREKQDVRCLQNHDSNMVLGRTKNNTLTLVEDDKGLRFECAFPDTQSARDLSTLLERGDIDQCSFGFTVLKQTWTETTNQDGSITEIREVEDVDLFDVSIVAFPAYEGATCMPRSLWPEGLPPEVREKRKLALKRDDDDACDCECPECENGNCPDCSEENCSDPNCEHERSRKPGESRDAKTRKVDGEDLPASNFLIVGDPEDTSTWKLPWKFSTEEKTKSHLRNALARFNQLKGVSDDDKSKAWTKLVKLCKEHDIDVTEEKSLRRHLTTEQLASFSKREAEGDADTLEACQAKAHQVKINVEEIITAIARAVEDPAAAIAQCRDEFQEIARLAAEAIEECGSDDSASMRAHAKARAIAASL